MNSSSRRRSEGEAVLAGYFGDTALHERLLLERYDKLQPRLDKAIGDDE
jgi:hypothetical protein